MMRKSRIALIAGAAVLALAGAAAMATEKYHAPNTTTSTIADDRATFTGDSRSIVVVDDPLAFGPFWFAPMAIEYDPSFAMFERMTRDIEREAAFIEQHAQSLANASLAPDDTVLQASFGNRPGSYSYSFVSTTSDGKNCTRSVQITSAVNGAKPQVVKNSSGDCDTVQTDWPEINVFTPQQEAPLKVKWSVEKLKGDSRPL